MAQVDQGDHALFDVTSPEKQFRPLVARDTRDRLNLHRFDRHDVEHAIRQDADRRFADLHNDHDMQRRCFSGAAAEPAAQVDDRHHGAAKIEHAAHIIRLFRQVGDAGPALDLADVGNFDTILFVIYRETDEFDLLSGIGGIV